jgi:uncharacterized membrane protein YesL
MSEDRFRLGFFEKVLVGLVLGLGGLLILLEVIASVSYYGWWLYLITTIMVMYHLWDKLFHKKNKD